MRQMSIVWMFSCLFCLQVHGKWEFSINAKPGISAVDVEDFHDGRVNDWDLFNYQFYFQAISLNEIGTGFGAEFGWSHILWYEVPTFNFSPVEVYEETFNISGLAHFSPSFYYVQGGPQLHIWQSDKVDISLGALGGVGFEIPIGAIKIPLGFRVEWISAEALLMTFGGNFGVKF